jgi:hypothetical protein
MISILSQALELIPQKDAPIGELTRKLESTQLQRGNMMGNGECWKASIEMIFADMRSFFSQVDQFLLRLYVEV